MERHLSKNNSGYSLVELLIVMAIIAVLAATAMISYTMVHSARAKDAAIKVGSEVNALKTKCMNMKPEGTEYSYYALSLYTVDDTPHICLVRFNKDTNTYDYIDEEDINLSSSVKVDFDNGNFRGSDTSVLWPTGADSDSSIKYSNYIPGHKNGDSETTSPVYICFDKRGNCYSGYGEYNFSKNNGTIVAHVTINMNGSVSVK